MYRTRSGFNKLQGNNAASVSTLLLSTLILLGACGSDGDAVPIPTSANQVSTSTPPSESTATNTATNTATDTPLPTPSNEPHLPPPQPVEQQPLLNNLEGYRDVGFTLPDCYQPELTTGGTFKDHPCSWVFQAGRLQTLLNRNLPLTQTTFPATHNSFNSTAYPGLSSTGDPNHTLTIAQQLSLGMEGLELDLHWLPHLLTANFAPVVCHGLGASMGHFGCTPQDRHLREVLTEIAKALELPENKGRVIMLDLEDSLADFSPPNSAEPSVAGHDQAAALFEQILGNKIYKPIQPEVSIPEGCTTLPIRSLSKQDVLDAGKQIVLVSGCGVGGQWKKWVFQFDRKQKANDGFDSTTCESDFFKPEDYTIRFTRLWHDSTQLGAFTNSSLKAIAAQDVRAMNLCGLHQTSIDRLVLGDERLTANIWSWETGFPKKASATRQCVFQAGNGRWQTGDCLTRRAYACFMPGSEGWRITPGEDRFKGEWQAGRTACKAEGGTFGLPKSAKQNAKLNEVLNKSGLKDVWINWADGVANAGADGEVVGNQGIGTYLLPAR
jgi:hypothetical protein